MTAVPNRNVLTALLGVAALAAVTAVVLHLGDANRFLVLTASARPEWIAAALLLQVANIPVRAAVFSQALRAGRPSFARICRLMVVALYTSATVPSAGLAGTWLTLRVLQWWGAPMGAAVAAVWVDVIAHYAAYAFVVGAAVGVQWTEHALSPAVGSMAAALGGLAITLTLVAFASQRWRGTRLLARWPLARGILDELASADPAILRSPRILGRAALLRGVNFAFDIATLWACLAAVGVAASASAALCALVAGALARTIGIVPSGMGTFEAAVVATYASFGVALEPALAAALLFRGLSFWLPLAPGLWWSRRLLESSADAGARLSSVKAAQSHDFR